MFFLLSVSLALTHCKESIVALPFPISVRGGSQSGLERSGGSGGSLIPLCLFRAPSASFTWGRCQEVAGGFCTVVACCSVLVLDATCASVRKGKTSRLFFKAQHEPERGRWKAPSGSLAEAEVLSWTAAAACFWRSCGPQGRDCISPAAFRRCALLLLALHGPCWERGCASPVNWTGRQSPSRCQLPRRPELSLSHHPFFMSCGLILGQLWEAALWRKVSAWSSVRWAPGRLTWSDVLEGNLFHYEVLVSITCAK